MKKTMVMNIIVLFFIITLCSIANSRCPNNRCPDNLKWGGRFQMANSPILVGGAPSIIIFELPRGPQKVLRAPSGRIHFWKEQGGPCTTSGNHVCPAPSEERPCLDNKMSCDHNYHPPVFNRTDSAILKLTNVTSNSLLVKWRGWNDNVDLGYGPVAGYKLEYRQRGGEFKPVRLMKNITSYQVNKLVAQTEYDFRLTVAGDGIFTGYGPSPTSIYSISTPCNDPGMLYLNIKSHTHNSAIFSMGFSQVANFTAWNCTGATMYLEREHGGQWISQNISGEPEIDIDTIEPCTTYTYRINITARITGGKTNITSNVVTFTSLAADPDEPILSLTSVNTSVAVMAITYSRLESWSCINWTITLYRRKMNKPKWKQRPGTWTEIPKSYSDTRLLSCTNYTYKIDIITSQIAIKNFETLEGQSVPEVEMHRNTYKSQTLYVATHVTAPTTSPNVVLQNNSTRNLTFGWRLPKCLCCNSFITGYSYMLKQNNSVLENKTTSNTTADCLYLTPYTHYTFEVRASTVGGHGDYGVPYSIMTLEDKPPKMDPPEKMVLNATTIKIKWEPPSPPHGIITGYNLRYGLNGSIVIWKTVTFEASRRDWMTSNVTADSDYVIKIRARTRIGYGDWSDRIIVRTEETAPGPPRSIAIVRRSETMLQVSWIPPEFPNGDIIKYEVHYNAMETPTSDIIEGTIEIDDHSMSSFVVNISPLEPSTMYKIEISAYTSAGKGDKAVINGSTNLTSDLVVIDVKLVKVAILRGSSGEDDFVITLPPLTQKYATNYVIAIRLSEKDPMFHILRELMKSDKEIEFILTMDDMRMIGDYLSEDSNPVIHVGVQSKCGEETLITWSNDIEIPVTVVISLSDLFITIIISCVVFAVFFLLIVFSSFMVCRHLQKEWRYKKTEFEDDSSIYHALQRRQTETIDRYMPLKIKFDIPERNLPSVNSFTKMRLENGENEEKDSCSIEDGEEALANKINLILLETSDVSVAGSAFDENAIYSGIDTTGEAGQKYEHRHSGHSQSFATYSTELPILGNGLTESGDNTHHASQVMGNSDNTTGKGRITKLGKLGSEEKQVINASVQKAANKFKAGLQQIYTAEIYNHAGTQRMTTTDPTTATMSSKVIVDGKSVVRQSYDKVIVSDVSPITRMHTNGTVASSTNINTKPSSSIDPVENSCQTEHVGGSGDGTKNEGNQTSSYIDLDEIDMKVSGLVVKKGGDRSLPTINPMASYMEIEEHERACYIDLDELAMATDNDEFFHSSKASYIELGEQAMTDNTASPATMVGASYLTLDDEAMRRDRDATISSSKASYIELDERAMADDTSSPATIVGASYRTLEEKAMRRDRDTTISGSKASYIELDEQAMADDIMPSSQPVEPSYFTLDKTVMHMKREATISSSNACYIELDDQAMARDNDAMFGSSKASYIELDEQVMAEGSSAQDIGASYLSLDEEAMARDRDATIASSNASYIELDEQVMAEDTSSPAHYIGAPYLTLDEEAMTRDRDATIASSKASYIELDEQVMADGTLSPGQKAMAKGKHLTIINELDKERMTFDEETSTSYTKHTKKCLTNKTETDDVLPSYNDTFKEHVKPQHYASDLIRDEIYDETGTPESIYDDSIIDQKNHGNSLVSNMHDFGTYDDTMVAHTGKYESSVTAGFGLRDDVYDENSVEGNHFKCEQGVSSHDDPIFTSLNEDKEKGDEDIEDIYFDADQDINIPSLIDCSNNMNTKNHTLNDESYYAETSFPEDAHISDTDEAQSIYEEIPAARAQFQKRKPPSFLQSLKYFMGASKGTKKSPLPALPLMVVDEQGDVENNEHYSSSLDPIQDIAQNESTYEVLPGINNIMVNNNFTHK